MQRRFRSIEWRHPALIVTVVVVAVAAFLWSAHHRLAAVVDDAAANRLLTNARLVASMLDGGNAGARARLSAIAGDALIIEVLRTGRVSAAASQRLARAAATDSLFVGRWVIAADGTVRASSPDATERVLWAGREAAAGRLPRDDLRISPLFDVGGEPLYELVVPVLASADDSASALLGHLVEARIARGRGVEQVRALAGTRTFLVGQPGSGIWTDLSGVAEGPPAFAPGDSVVRFDESAWGPGIGAVWPIAGTPWVVWLGLARDEVHAPLRDWLRRVVPIAILLVVVAAVLAWSLSRRITSRLVSLSRQMDALELGDLAPTAALAGGPDELGRLEGSFQQLLERARSHKRLESQLLASQKLEAVGRLAGGIAHDFNNMLTVVSNYGEMVKADLPPGSPAEKDMDEVLRAADRAARLTRQLLTFSGRRVVAPQLLDLNAIVRDSQGMLERLIPERVRFQWELDDRIGPIRADHGQIEQVLLNLALNAADAMPDGGELTIRTTRALLDEPVAASGTGEHPTTGAERSHICLAVRDTGIGMDRETSARIFEPFFTTKPSGKGTGLGLATVHGIVTQVGGRIWVYSEPGHGTTFKVYFPEERGTAEPPSVRPRRIPIALGVGGTVLLVEDDVAARKVTRRLLVRAGYDVVEAEDGAAAVALLERPEFRADLVLSDVVMPGVGGAELAERVGRLRPGLPVILMSGYNDLPASTWGQASMPRTLLEKPFTSVALLDVVRQSITSPPPGSAPPPAAPR